MKRCAVLLTGILWLAGSPATGQDLPLKQAKEQEPPPPRMGISGGLGVSYVSATDLVDRINGSGLTTERLSGFVAAAEFFGVFTYPLSREWVLKLDYAYMVGSYSVQAIVPGTEFSFSAHLPSIIGQYVLIDKGIYNVKGGAGLGYHFGSYLERYGTYEATFTGSGPAVKLDLEANTAFGESFYAYLGVDFRFDFIGALTPEGSQSTGSGVAPTLDFFSAGAKLGFTFYL